MDKMIAHCGLDCTKCDAYIATINNDDELRESVANEMLFYISTRCC